MSVLGKIASRAGMAFGGLGVAAGIFNIMVGIATLNPVNLLLGVGCLALGSQAVMSSHSAYKAESQVRRSTGVGHPQSMNGHH